MGALAGRPKSWSKESAISTKFIRKEENDETKVTNKECIFSLMKGKKDTGVHSWLDRKSGRKSGCLGCKEV